MAAILTLFSDFCASFARRAARRMVPDTLLPNRRAANRSSKNRLSGNLQEVKGPAGLVFCDVAAVEADHDIYDVVEMGLV